MNIAHLLGTLDLGVKLFVDQKDEQIQVDLCSIKEGNDIFLVVLTLKKVFESEFFLCGDGCTKQGDFHVEDARLVGRNGQVDQWESIQLISYG